MIQIETCESAETGDLLRVLGYRMRGGCGSDVVLETVNASRAFLTIDSGFPLAELEQALRTNRPFTLDYHPARSRSSIKADYWQSAKEKTPGEFIDYFLVGSFPVPPVSVACRKLDPETADAACAKRFPPRGSRSTRTCSISSAACSQIRDGKAVFRAARAAKRCGPNWPARHPDKGAAFSRG